MSDPAEKTVLSIRVRSQQGEEVYFRIKPHTVMQKVIKAFSEKLGADSSTIRLMFDGQRVDPNTTASEVGLQDNDILEVMEFQVGGGCQ